MTSNAEAKASKAGVAEPAFIGAGVFGSMGANNINNFWKSKTSKVSSIKDNNTQRFNYNLNQDSDIVLTPSLQGSVNNSRSSNNRETVRFGQQSYEDSYKMA